MVKLQTFYSNTLDNGQRIELQVGDDARLYVNGAPVKTESKLRLSFWQAALGAAAALGAVASGVADVVSLFLTK